MRGLYSKAPLKSNLPSAANALVKPHPQHSCPNICLIKQKLLPDFKDKFASSNPITGKKIIIIFFSIVKNFFKTYTYN